MWFELLEVYLEIWRGTVKMSWLFSWKVSSSVMGWVSLTFGMVGVSRILWPSSFIWWGTTFFTVGEKRVAAEYVLTICEHLWLEIRVF